MSCCNICWFPFSKYQHVPHESQAVNRAIPCFDWTHTMICVLLNKSHNRHLLKAFPLLKEKQSSQSSKEMFFHGWNCFHSILDDPSPEFNDFFFILIAFFVFIAWEHVADSVLFWHTIFPIGLNFFYFSTIMGSGIKNIALKCF